MITSNRARFADRADAGRRLAEALKPHRFVDPLVLALPRGGVPVGYEVAKALGAPLDVLLVRKIGAPGNPEYGIGAVVDGSEPQLVLNDDAIAIVQPPPGYVEAEKDRQLVEIERRRKLYAGDRPPVSIAGRTVILVDDGIATGGTVRAALKALRAACAARIVLAVPTAPADVIDRLATEADLIVCLTAPELFTAVGAFYSDFDQTSDAEVIRLLKDAARATAARETS